MVVLGVIFVMARPVIGSLGKKISDGLKGGFFAEDMSGSNFYYFPVR
jgi:hypothetical protein